MGGQGRGKKRGKKKKEKEKVTEEQSARKEIGTGAETETEIFDRLKLSALRSENGTGMWIVDWLKLSALRFEKVREKGEADLFNGCDFLVRTKSSNITAPHSGCHREDFHLIDLVSKSVIPYYYPSIINCVGIGTMLLFGDHQAYIFGEIDEFQPLTEHTHDVDHRIHKNTGASRISVSSCWEPFVSPDTNQNMANPAVLSDKMYSFGFPLLCPHVYCPCPQPHASKLWNRLPLLDDLVDTHVSSPVLPDPSNSRIIVHLPRIAKLYAFYPAPNQDEGGKWKQLASDFYTWNSAVAIAIADNIIFFHPDEVHGIRDLLFAYDLNTSTWLRIEWDFSNIDTFIVVYDAIFTLSNNGLMCLASGIHGSSVHFLRFRVKRTGDTHLKLTAIDYQIHDIPSATHIFDIISF